MSVLVAAEKRPFTAVTLFLAGVVGLLWLAGWNGWVALGVAAVIGARLAVSCCRHGSAMYVSLDCADGHHAACAGCWCDTCPHDGTHTIHAIAVTEANR